MNFTPSLKPISPSFGRFITYFSGEAFNKEGLQDLDVLLKKKPVAESAEQIQASSALLGLDRQMVTKAAHMGKFNTVLKFLKPPRFSVDGLYAGRR